MSLMWCDILVFVTQIVTGIRSWNIWADRPPPSDKVTQLCRWLESYLVIMSRNITSVTVPEEERRLNLQFSFVENGKFFGN